MAFVGFFFRVLGGILDLSTLLFVYFNNEKPLLGQRLQLR